MSGRIHSHITEAIPIGDPWYYNQLLLGVESDPYSFFENFCVEHSLSRTVAGVRDLSVHITIYGNVRHLVSHFVGPYEIEI